MQEFLNIDWSWKKFRSNSENLQFHRFAFAPENETDVFYTNLNEIDPIHYSDHCQAANGNQFSVLPIDPRTNTVVERLVVDVTAHRKAASNLFNRFPTKSKLNRAQHQMCLRALRQMHTPYDQLTKLDKVNRDAFQALLPKIDAENEEFNQFVRSYFMANLLGRKRAIAPAMNAFVENNWRRNVGRMLLAEDQRFQLQSALPLTVSESESKVSVRLVRTLRQTGWVPRSKFEIGHSVNSYLKRNLDQMSQLQDRKLKNRASQRERMVKDLLDDRDLVLDVVVANLSTLILLCSHPTNTTSTWAVPFEIVPQDGDGHDLRKTCVLQKPLPPLAMGTHARNMKAHKYAFKSTFLHFEHKSAYSLDRDCKLGDCPDLVKPTEKAKAAQSHSDMDYQVQTFDEYLRQVTTATGPSDDFFSNTICRLYELHADEQEPLKMAVITHQDCCDKLAGQLVSLHLSLKLEHQPEFGAEEMAKEELVREWFRLRFGGPESKVVRVRIDAQTSNCLSHTYLDVADVKEELRRLYGCDPADLVRQFHSMMRIVCNFPEGHYLLRHDEKNADKVMIYQRTTAAASSFSLHDQYGKGVQFERPQLEPYEWTKIDRLLPTQVHLRSCVLPGCFPHWGNNAGRLLQDRVKVKPPPVTKATPQQRKKAKKLQKRKNKAKKQKATAEKLPPGESLDPRELFNASGEIDNEFLARSPEKVQAWSFGAAAKVESPKVLHPIDVDAYINDARMAAQPITKNLSLNALQGYESDSSDDFLGFEDR